jgi:hypothetical protein
MYPTGIHKINELKHQFSGSTFPSADLVASRLLAIPTHHLVTEGDKEAICALLVESGLLHACAAIGSESVKNAAVLRTAKTC